MIVPQGIIVAMSTPFHADESVNFEALRQQVHRFIEAGIDGLFCLGTNGEFYALGQDEKIAVMAAVKEEAAGKVPVYAGTGAITTKEAIFLTRKAAEIGVDGVSVLPPYFAASSQADLLKHFGTIADAVDVPIVLYNIPARTGVNIDYQTVATLAKTHKNVVGVKDSSGNFDTILRYIEETETSFSVLSGNDSLILWTLMAGGRGGISGIANIYPKTMASIFDLWQAGEFEQAKQVQDSIRPIRDCLKLANPNSIVKRATALLGQDVGPVREPFNVNDAKIDAVLRDVMEDLQLE